MDDQRMKGEPYSNPGMQRLGLHDNASFTEYNNSMNKITTVARVINTWNVMTANSKSTTVCFQHNLKEIQDYTSLCQGESRFILSPNHPKGHII